MVTLQMVKPRPGESLNDCHLDGVLRAWCVLFAALSAGGQKKRPAVIIWPIFGWYLMAQNLKRYKWYKQEVPLPFWFPNPSFFLPEAIWSLAYLFYQKYSIQITYISRKYFILSSFFLEESTSLFT